MSVRRIDVISIGCRSIPANRACSLLHNPASRSQPQCQNAESDAAHDGENRGGLQIFLIGAALDPRDPVAADIAAHDEAYEEAYDEANHHAADANGDSAPGQTPTTRRPANAVPLRDMTAPLDDAPCAMSIVKPWTPHHQSRRSCSERDREDSQSEK